MGGNIPNYPHWLYKDEYDPVLVKNTDQEQKWVGEGYDSITASRMSNKHLINWFWDLEDFSPRQLRVFALEEYGVDLPEDATQEILFNAVIELTRAAPQNRNRLILMAHTVKMNYDETLDQIRDMMKVPEGATVDNVYEEFTA
ncbi:MAG: hypothetical protein KAJ09_01535 [Deltaproteobacteria bacterium]|nr:hypothetical protein [Deltaproteobacteria bacterium]